MRWLSSHYLVFHAFVNLVRALYDLTGYMSTVYSECRLLYLCQFFYHNENLIHTERPITKYTLCSKEVSLNAVSKECYV